MGIVGVHDFGTDCIFTVACPADVDEHRRCD
jgi:hypothetical protein